MTVSCLLCLGTSKYCSIPKHTLLLYTNSSAYPGAHPWVSIRKFPQRDKGSRSEARQLFQWDQMVSGGVTAGISKLQPAFAFTNKLVLEHSHTHFFMYYLKCFHTTSAELSSCNTDHMA